MSHLIIDIGNTRTKVAIFEDGLLVEKASYAQLASQQLSCLFTDFPTISNVIISSTKNEDQELISELDRYDCRVLVLDENTPVPIVVDYLTPHTLGRDRLAAVVGAHDIFQSENVLVIDAGTAVTYDYIDNKGVYHGGFISPGAEMRSKALHTFTDKLPLVKVRDVSFVTGKNTQMSLEGGVFYGLLYEMNGFINHFKKQSDPLKIILTGGNGTLFEKYIDEKCHLIEDITVRGLNKILEFTISSPIN